ncbi:hypothetical protein [Mucilaginibacter celer]|uniref:Uncharacterized protein n=1 Tax=Mucilaginibacter celer TaxID=2305508 RepID=A0A494VV68_9SPHI|nr:hypothetical protein [Mucilaginibacter celer]AYL98894.1 hypothetical protein HYN43_028070 [Mucilaginibacter celer]
MTTLTIEIPEKSEKTLAELVEQLGGKIISVKGDKTAGRAARKKQVLDDLEESVAFVKLHQQGKVEAQSMQELLDEL